MYQDISNMNFGNKKRVATPVTVAQDQINKNN